MKTLRTIFDSLSSFFIGLLCLGLAPFALMIEWLFLLALCIWDLLKDVIEIGDGVKSYVKYLVWGKK